MLPLNDPNIISEITGLHDNYEQALVAKDVAALNRSFWSSPHVVRFGVGEQLYGAEAIAAYRNDSPPVPLDRHIFRRTITAFGSDMATVMCEISQTVAGQPRTNRQSQVWVRFPDIGWKIVSAHVSQAAITSAAAFGSYVDRTAAAIELPLHPSHRVGVIGNVQRAAALAGPLLEFELPAHVEIAPVFTP